MRWYGVSGPAQGVRLGVDVGEARVGVAVSDPEGRIATPSTTLRRDRRKGQSTASGDSPDSGDGKESGDVPGDMAALVAMVAEYEAVEVIVGLPVTLSGAEGPAAAHARAYAQRLAPLVAPVPVTLADERMSTLAATRRLSERGVRGRRRREVIDQAAAVEILQGWLDARRREA